MADRPDIVDKRWAQRGQALRLSQLDDLRHAAEQWRNGLAGLTAVLAVVTVFEGDDLAHGASSAGRLAIGIAAAVGFLALLFGSWRAMRAAFGLPDERVLLSGAELRRWSATQVDRGVADLRLARASFFAGLLALLVAVGIAWFDDDDTTLVRVSTPEEILCGDLLGSRDGTIELDVHEDHGGRIRRTVTLADVQVLVPTSSC